MFNVSVVLMCKRRSIFKKSLIQNTLPRYMLDTYITNKNYLK